MSSIAITGASGFIGSKLVPYFAEQGHQVVAILSNNTQKKDSLFKEYKNVETVLWDEADQYFANIFIHLAWSNSSGPKRGDVVSQMENIDLLKDAISLSEKMNIEKFVGIGTITELEVERVDYSNTTPGESFIYGVTKNFAKNVAQFECKKRNIDFQWLRLGNIYGKKDTTGRFFTTMLSKLIQNQELNLSLGDQLTDFIYEDDALKAIYNSAIFGKNNQTYYIGAGKPIPLKNVILKMQKISESKSIINFGVIDSTPIYLKENDYSIESLTEDTEYRPETSLDKGIEILVNDLLQTDNKVGE